MEELEGRLEELERVVYGDGAPRKIREAISTKIEDVQKNLNYKVATLGTQWEKYKDQTEKFYQKEKVVQSKSENIDAKRAVVLSNDEYLSQFEAKCSPLSSLIPVLDNENIRTEGIQNLKTFAPLLPLHEEQNEATELFHQRVNALLEHYNSVVLLLSQQFLNYHSILNDIEDEVKKTRGV